MKKNVKKIFSLVMVLCLAVTMLGLTACGGSGSGGGGGSTTDGKTDGAPEKSANAYDIDGNIFELTASNLMEDSEGEINLVTTWNFTNNTEEATNSMFLFFYTFTQGDTELTDSGVIFTSEDGYDSLLDYELQDVEPGETGTFYLWYRLNDQETPVSVRLSDLLDEDVYELEIPIADLQVVGVDALNLAPLNDAEPPVDGDDGTEATTGEGGVFYIREDITIDYPDTFFVDEDAILDSVKALDESVRVAFIKEISTESLEGTIEYFDSFEGFEDFSRGQETIAGYTAETVTYAEDDFGMTYTKSWYIPFDEPVGGAVEGVRIIASSEESLERCLADDVAGIVNSLKVLE